jgi:hypothetical protein
MNFKLYHVLEAAAPRNGRKYLQIIQAFKKERKAHRYPWVWLKQNQTTPSVGQGDGETGIASTANEDVCKRLLWKTEPFQRLTLNQASNSSHL